MDDYPKTVQIRGGEALLRLMTPTDGPLLARFAATLRPQDLQFMRRDITQPETIIGWIEGIAHDRFTTLLALAGAELLGYVTVHPSDVDWSRHVAEVRVVVGPAGRGRDLGRQLLKAAIDVAAARGLEKLSARMTLDQMNARALFEQFNFRPEALLKNEVKERSGRKHDLLIFSLDLLGRSA